MIDTTFARLRGQVTDVVKQDMFGLDDVIHLCLIALCTKGHILLEGNPGLGKTALVRALSSTLALPYGRIQFTPDLLPSDITGTLTPVFASNGGGETSRGLEFRPGPIFTSMLLADEINRATPKTQSAMLEAMAERQATVLGETYSLDQHNFVAHILKGETEPRLPTRTRPFIVMATQNPIDQEGTYDLPEAQSDRFMFKILMPIPDRKILGSIIEKESGPRSRPESVDRSLLPTTPEKATQMINALNGQIKDHPMSDEALEHICNLYLVTNQPIDAITTISNNQKMILKRLKPLLLYGLGPRAARDLALAAKALSLSAQNEAERNEAGPSVVARVLLPVVRHRLKPKYGWEDELKKIQQELKLDLPEFAQLDSGIEHARKIDVFIKCLADACVPTTLRRNSDYRNIFNSAMSKDMLNRVY